ncbi:MAG: DUF5758 domain-containing protein [Clostridium sp.]
MKKIFQKELDYLIDKHEIWLKNPEKGNRLILDKCDLSSLNIKNRNLKRARFYNCNMNGMRISYCDMSYAGFYSSNMKRIFFENCNFFNETFYENNLREACFLRCRLINIELRSSNFSRAKIKDCELKNIATDSGTSFYSLQCPEEGAFIGFKKAVVFVSDVISENYIVTNMNVWTPQPVIVKLQITEDSLRSSATSRKCRCSKAKVLSISYLDGTECPEGTIAYSQYDSDFIYKIGDILEIKNFDENRWEECSTGIHFFITREEAVNY